MFYLPSPTYYHHFITEANLVLTVNHITTIIGIVKWFTEPLERSKMTKRTTITVNEEIFKEVQKLKKKHFDKSYSEIYRMLLKAGVESVKEQKPTK